MKERKISDYFWGNAIVFNSSIRELEIFLNETEKFFKEREKTLKLENVYYDDLDERFLFYNWFPNLQRRNFIILLVSIIEYETRLYCHTLYQYKKVVIKCSDLHGTSIEKFLLYTEKLAGLKFDFKNDIIQKLKYLNELRNFIIHKNGFIDGLENRKKIIEFAKLFEGVKLINSQIYLSKSFCEDTLDLVDSFFNEIFKSGFLEYENSEKD